MIFVKTQFIRYDKDRRLLKYWNQDYTGYFRYIFRFCCLFYDHMLMSLLGSRPVSWRCPRSMCWIWAWRSVWSPTLVLWMSPYLTRSSFLSSTATSPWTSILKVRFLTNQLLHFTVIVALLIVKQLEHLVSKSTFNNKNKLSCDFFEMQSFCPVCM